LQAADLVFLRRSAARHTQLVPTGRHFLDLGLL
jgi:hypothetical protein